MASAPSNRIPAARRRTDREVEGARRADSPQRVLDKVGEYLEAGVRLVWVIDPQHRRAVIHRGLSSAEQIDGAGVLDGEDALPGFRCPLAQVFD